MAIANIIAMILVLIGGLNWGLFGLFNFNLVEFLCMKNKIATRVVYVLVLIATLWLIISWIINGAIIFAM